MDGKIYRYNKNYILILKRKEFKKFRLIFSEIDRMSILIYK
jgi:hypothetical protein